MITEQYLKSKNFRNTRGNIWEHTWKRFVFRVSIFESGVFMVGQNGLMESKVLTMPEQLDALYSALTVGGKL